MSVKLIVIKILAPQNFCWIQGLALKLGPPKYFKGLLQILKVP